MYKIVKVDMLYEPIPEVQVDKSEITFTFLSGSDTITATSTKDIEYILIDDTNTFSVTQNGNQFTIRSTDNMSLNSRTATIKFRSYNSRGQYIDTVVPITQEAAPLASTTTTSIEEYTAKKDTTSIEFDVNSYYPISVTHNNINGYITNIAITNNVITDSLTTRHVTVTLDVNQFIKKEVNEIVVESGFIGNTFSKVVTITSYFVPIYGVVIDNTISDPSASVIRIASDMTLHATLPVHEAMLPCDIDPSTGAITYLDKNDLTKDINGNTVTVPSTGNNLNRMIELPECYMYTDTGGDKFDIKVVLVSMEEFTREDAKEIYSQIIDSSIHMYGGSVYKIPKRYMAMYEGYKDGNSIIRSIPGKKPTVSTSGVSFHSYCRANNSKNYDWNMLTSSTWLFVNIMFTIEYKTLNSQLTFNSSLTSEGYHQGGLGLGITSQSSVATNPTLTNCNSYGANGGTTHCCYRGIVNPFGNCFKELVDVYINGYTIYHTTNKKNYSRDINHITENYFDSRQTYSNSGYITNFLFSLNGSYPSGYDPVPYFIFGVMSASGGSDSSYFCDYYYISSADYGWFTGGDYGYGSHAGLWYSVCSSSVGYSDSSIGCRLTYLPNDPYW